MKIAVLNYENGAVDIIDVPNPVILAYGGCENYLIEHCKYDMDEINWMEVKQEEVNYLNHVDIGSSDSNSIMLRLKEFDHFVRRTYFINKDEISCYDFYHTDEILVTDKDIFYDNEEHSLRMKFYDGFAIEDVESKPRVMFYPSQEILFDYPDMMKAVKEYCSDGSFTPFNVALKYGKVYEFDDIIKLK